MKPDLKVVSPKKTEDRTPILKVRDLTQIFPVNQGFLKVLEGIRITAATGELICILGPSGCGKSTLLKVLSGFLPPSAGDRKSTRLNSSHYS